MNDDMKQELRKKFKKAVRVGSQLSELVIQLKGKPGPLEIMALGSRALDTLNELAQKEDRDLDRTFEGWTDHYVPFSSSVFEMLRASQRLERVRKDSEPPEEEAGHHKGPYVSHHDGLTLGWMEYGTWVDGPYTELAGDEIDRQVSALLGRFVWEKLGTRITLDTDERDRIGLRADLLGDSLPSPTSRKIIQRLKRFEAAGRTRSVLLWGEPGTGKSYITREVGKAFGGLTLRMTSETLGDADVSGLIQFLAPNVILIDDFDRLQNQGQVIKHFERLREVSKLLLITVNDMDELDRAVLRPGRIDDVIEVNKLDEEVFQKLTEGLSDEEKSKLRGLPVAYLSHFVETKEVLGAERAWAELSELAERLERIKNMKGREPREPWSET